jgi:hypothetical protein
MQHCYYLHASTEIQFGVFIRDTVIYTAHLFSQMQMAVGDWRTLFVALETPAPPEAKLTPFA